MKDKTNKPKRRKNTSGLIFSAILVTAFVICSYFFMSMINKVDQSWLKALLCIAVFTVFGLFLFYATRVGDGKQVVRFSPATLIIMDLPALYIILAVFISALPFSEEITSCAPLIYLAAVTFGYGVPYTFLSGYEIDDSEISGESSDEADESGEDEEEFVVEAEGSGEVVIPEDEDEYEASSESEDEHEAEHEIEHESAVQNEE